MNLILTILKKILWKKVLKNNQFHNLNMSQKNYKAIMRNYKHIYNKKIQYQKKK